MQLLVIQIYPLEQAEGPANTWENNNLLRQLKYYQHPKVLISLPPDSLPSLKSRRSKATTKEMHKISNDNS